MNRILRAFAILLLLVVGLEKSNSYAVRNLAITNLVISPGTLSPIFSTANATYTCSEVYAVSSVTVTAVSNNPIGVIVNNGPSVTVSSGSPSKALSMNIGTNIITIQAGAGIVYSITVTRASPGVNKNGKEATGSDYLDSNGKIGGTSSINSNGKLTPAGG